MWRLRAWWREHVWHRHMWVRYEWRGWDIPPPGFDPEADWSPPHEVYQCGYLFCPAQLDRMFESAPEEFEAMSAGVRPPGRR